MAPMKRLTSGGIRESRQQRHNRMFQTLVVGLISIISISVVQAVTQDGSFGYVAETNVTQLMNLALDIRDMRATDDLTAKRQIYEQGSNALPYTLAGLSLNSSQYIEFPLYNVYTYAFYELGLTVEKDSSGEFDGMPVDQYANTLVTDLFDVNGTRIEADGSLILNVVMAYWGGLWQMLRACERQDDRAVMVGYLDQAAALWIGTGQERASNTKGYMLYNLAERAGTNFGQDGSDGESQVNRYVLESFVSIKTNIDNNMCNSDSGYRQIRQKVKLMVKATNTVLVQMLLYHIDVSDDSNFIELYTLSLLPQIGACNSYAIDTLLDKAVAHDLVDDDSKAVVVSALQSSYSCLLLGCNDVGAYQGNLIEECNETSQSLASYVPSTDVRYKSYIDRDLRQMRMFMRMEAYQAAKDLYQYGWNTYFTLQQMALTFLSPPVTSIEYQRLQLYLGDENYLDNTILNILDEGSPFDSASTDERDQAAIGLLEGVVFYISMTSQLESAISACSNPGSTDESAASYWDTGAAFFIGSMEGQTEDLAERGQLLYGLGKSLCTSFMTCESNNAAVNKAVLSYLSVGRDQLAGGGCQQALGIVRSNIKPALLIPLIQANLFYATLSHDGDDGSTGALFAFSRAILPSVNEVNRTSAAAIKSNSDFSTTTDPDLDAVFSAFHAAIPLMDVACDQIGILNINGRGVCDGTTQGSTTSTPASNVTPTSSPVPMPPTNPSGLAWGRYNFVNDTVAEDDSMFTLDVRDIMTATDATTAEAAYTQPSKYATKGLWGTPGLSSLSDLSAMAFSIMKSDPLFNFYLISFFDDDDFENATATASAENFAYANTIVELALNPQKGNSPQLAADATVALNLFMLIAHRLYESTRLCRQQADAVSSIDSAVALWIGQEQEEGKFDSGWSMYAQSQQAAKLYGSLEEESEANTKLMGQFNAAQATAKACASSSGKWKELRLSVDQIIRTLSIPLLQRMLFHISENNRNYVELYSLAFIPQTVSCDIGAFEHLRDMLFLDFDLTHSLSIGLISRLGKVLQCLRYTCSDLGNTENGSAELKSLVSSLCNEIDSYSETASLAGYETDSDVSELARVDLDVLQVQIFMKLASYDLATDLYENGRNSLNGAGIPISLQSLATDDSRTTAGATYDLFEAYYQTDTYADDLVLKAINISTDNGSSFEGASRIQRSEIVARTLQTMVPFMQIISRLESAISRCKATQSGQQFVDEAAALYAGSIEGKAGGGDSDGSGVMLFALGQEMCAEFDECQGYDDASLNEFILGSFRDMKRSISSKDCVSAESIMNDAISMLPIPMIQGTLSLAIANSQLEARSDNASIASGYIFASAVLPLVKAANATSAAAIHNNMEFNLDVPPVSDGPEAIFEAFRDALPGMGINCQYVGTIAESGLSACEPDPLGAAVNTSTKLGGDLYVSTTNVLDRANIALDVKNMEDALLVGREALATIIYQEGENSPVYDSDGMKTDLRSLAKFSTEANVTMKENPLYQITVYAIRDSNGLYLGEDAGKYADTIVKEALASGSKTSTPIAAEASVALNLWMELANELFQTLVNCKNRVIVDDDGIRSIDEAAAYWIGDGQVKGNAENGHLLYALAEKMGDIFQTNESGQSKVNVNILQLFQQAKLELSATGACSNPVAYQRIRHDVNQIISQMVVVNLQALIDSLLANDRPRVRIYSHAVVPLVAACSPSTFSFLRSKLLDGVYTEAEVSTILDSIRSTFPCFNLVCADVGSHASESTPCSDPDPRLPLTGYNPTTNVLSLAKLDLDLQELDILLQMQAYGPAEDLYSYGKHAIATSAGGSTELSFQQLATDPGRSIVPTFQTFTQYFGADNSYSDTIVRYQFVNGNQMGPDERRVVVLGLAQYMTLYMSVLTALEGAVKSCEAGSDDAAAQWDTAAAWLIGSLEGSKEAGSDEGRLLWALAKQVCGEFHTCSTSVPGSAAVNDRLLLKLYSGRGAVSTKSCQELRKTATDISNLLPIPFIQAALSVATQLNKAKAGPQQQALLAKGYVYSQTILPLIQSVNGDAAKTIASHFDLNGMSTPDEVNQIVSAYTSVLSGMNINCQDVGGSDSIDVCTGTVSSASKAGIALGVLFGLLILGGLVYYWWKRRVRTKEQEALIFKDPTGELNHAAEFMPTQPQLHSHHDDDNDDFEEKKEDTPNDSDRYNMTRTKGDASSNHNKSSRPLAPDDDDLESADERIQVV